MSEIKLLPCPFCGGEAKYIKRTNEHPYVHAVWCENCNCRTSFEQSEKEVIHKWNARKPMDRIVEQLECEMYSEMKNAAFGKHHKQKAKGLEKAIEIVKGGAE